MVAAGTLIEPGNAVAYVCVRTRPGRHVRRALRHPAPLGDGDRGASRGRTTADASLRILANLGRSRVGVLAERSVIGLAADIAHRKHDVSRELAFYRKAPLLVSGREQVWIDTGRGID